MPSSATSSTAPQASGTGTWGRFALRGLGTIAAAVLANVAVYFVGRALVSYDPQFPPLANVSGAIIFTVVPALGAVLLYAALLRFTGNPVRLFRSIAAVALVVSLIPDFTYIPTVPGATGGQTAVLVLMHLAAAAVIVGLLTTRARPQAR